jgi:hypothetical protein
MAKLVKMATTSNEMIFVNSETIRLIRPSGGNSMIVYGGEPTAKVEVQGDPQAVAAKLIS